MKLVNNKNFSNKFANNFLVEPNFQHKLYQCVTQ